MQVKKKQKTQGGLILKEVQLTKKIIIEILKKQTSIKDQFKGYYVLKERKWMNLLTDLQKTGIDKASKEGKIYILEVWRESGKLEQEYSERSIDEVEKEEVLDWWLNSGKTLKYTTKALLYASQNENLKILNWWCRQKKKVQLKVDYKKKQEKYDEILGVQNTNVQVMEWWRKNKKGVYREVLKCYCPSVHDYDIQEWILKNKIKLGHMGDYYEQAYENATFYGEDLNTLKFLKKIEEQGQTEDMSYYTGMSDYKDGYMDILEEIIDWYIENNYEFEFLQKERFVIRKEENNYYRILE